MSPVSMYVHSSTCLGGTNGAVKLSLRGGGRTGADVEELRDFLAGGKAGTAAPDGTLLGGGDGGGGRGLCHFVSFVVLL